MFVSFLKWSKSFLGI